MHRLIATDLDGTLLDEEHVLTADTIATFHKLNETEHYFVIASGRHHVNIKGVRHVIGVPAYTISSNGARVHAPDDSLIYVRDLDPAVARAILAAKIPSEIVRNVFASSEWLIDRDTPSLLQFHRDSGFMCRVADFRTFGGQGVAKILLVGDPDLSKLVEKTIPATHGSFVTTTWSMLDCLELMALGVSKGVALHAVMKQLRASPDVVLAFGDGLNDIEMLRIAGHAHIMGNAHPKLFQLFPKAAHIRRNTDGAVAATLRRLLPMSADLANSRNRFTSTLASRCLASE